MRPRRPSDRRRRGSNLVETAVVLPVSLMLIIGTCVIGLGIFRYQQMATLAREGARYASVHGTQYQQDTLNAAATPTDVYNNAILPMAVGLNPTYLTYYVTWDKTNSPTSPVGSNSQPQQNTVSVTVNYQWTPELYITGPITLTSKSVMPMSY
jgi:Flp pilus assembly protein TadG